jgi:hypothetical protein
MGHYPADLHGCIEPIDFEESLGEYHTRNDDGTEDYETGSLQSPAKSGAFPIQIGALIPKTVDGFLAAEKNISQSRIGNAATRVQPTVMGIGEAAGSLAAIAVKNRVSLRIVNTAAVQVDLAQHGALITPWRIPGLTRNDPGYSLVSTAITRGYATYTIIKPSPVPGARYTSLKFPEPYISITPSDLAAAKIAGTYIRNSVQIWLDDRLCKGIPSITTSAQITVASSSALLNGRVHPHCLSTLWRFEYGKTLSYGAVSTTTSILRSTLIGSQEQSVSATLTALKPGTTYHYRLIGTNRFGRTNGEDRVFTTSIL